VDDNDVTVSSDVSDVVGVSVAATSVGVSTNVDSTAIKMC